jgi:hypothetical protein
MLEAKIPGLRLTGFNGEVATTVINKGVFMRRAGAFVAGDIPVGTPGYASVGDAPKMVLADMMTHSGYGVFPVDKIILQQQDADQDLDTIASGAMLRYYKGGEYETDEYDITVSGTGTAPGDLLYLNPIGQICTSGWDFATPIGEVVSVSAFPASTSWFNGGNSVINVNAYKKTVWYRLYESHAEASHAYLGP